MPEGKCPKCGKALTYGSLIPEEGMIYYEVYCNPCGFRGREYYEMDFDGIIEVGE